MQGHQLVSEHVGISTHSTSQAFPYMYDLQVVSTQPHENRFLLAYWFFIYVYTFAIPPLFILQTVAGTVVK